MPNTIFIGTTMRREGVMHNEIFTVRPAALIKALEEKYPLIGLLFVPLDEYDAAKAEMLTTGTARNQAFLQAGQRV